MRMIAIRRDIRVEDVYKQAKKEKKGKVRARLLAIAAIMENKSRSQAAKIAGITADNIRRWIKRFNQEGFDGLRDKKQTGREPKWTRETEQYLKDKVSTGACFEKDERVTYRLVDFQLELKEKFNILYGISTIWYKLRELGFSWITTRKQHPKSNLEIQEEFKKNFYESRRDSTAISR
jgi:transposase